MPHSRVQIRESESPDGGPRGGSRRAEAGVIFIWVMVSFFVIAVLLIAAVQPASIIAKQEKEKELVFRGEEYTEAIRLFQAEHGGAFPTKLKQLMEQGPRKHRYIRRLYRNPFDLEGKWILLGPGTTVVSKDESGKTVYKSSGPPTGIRSTPLTAPKPQGGGAASGGSSQLTKPGQGAGTPAGPGQILPFRIGSQEGQPIMGVYCNLHEQAFQDLRGKNYYDEWFFSPLVIPPPTPPGVRGTPQVAPGGKPIPK